MVLFMIVCCHGNSLQYTCKSEKEIPGVWLIFTVIARSLRWPNTVFARALADAIQRAHKDCKNKHAVDTAIIYLLNVRSIFAIFLRN